MGSDPKTSVVNRYGQSWISNLFILGGSTHPSIGGFNPTLTIEALAFMSAGSDREPLLEKSRGAALAD